MIFYHGGIADLDIGDILRPSPPHGEDDCPMCAARAAGRPYTAGEARLWALDKARDNPEGAERFLKALEGADPRELIDPPTGQARVYLTTDRDYGRFYAARSRGDLYRVEPIGPVEKSPEDHLPAWMALEARVVEVLERSVYLDRRDRRMTMRKWKRADAAARRTGSAGGRG